MVAIGYRAAADEEAAALGEVMGLNKRRRTDPEGFWPSASIGCWAQPSEDNWQSQSGACKLGHVVRYDLKECIQALRAFKKSSQLKFPDGPDN